MSLYTKKELLGLGAGVITVLAAHFGISVYKAYHDPSVMRTKELPLEAINTVEIPETSKEKIPDYTKMTWQKAIEEVKTPQEAREYIRQIFSPSKEYYPSVQSFSVSHYNGIGDCNERCFAAAALLSDNGYTPNMLLLVPNIISTEKSKGTGHAVFVYKTNKRLGVIDDKFADPEFETIGELINEVGKSTGTKYSYYKLCDLNYTFPSQEWISGKNSLPGATNGVEVITTFNRIKQ